MTFVEPLQEPEGEVIKILRGLTQSQVTVIDPSAHMNRTILKAFQMVKFHDLAASAQARITVLIFPSTRFPTWTTFPARSKRWRIRLIAVIVRNRVKIPSTKFFDGSLLERDLLDYSAVIA